MPFKKRSGSAVCPCSTFSRGHWPTKTQVDSRLFQFSCSCAGTRLGCTFEVLPFLAYCGPVGPFKQRVKDGDCYAHHPVFCHFLFLCLPGIGRCRAEGPTFGGDCHIRCQYDSERCGRFRHSKHLIPS